MSTQPSTGRNRNAASSNNSSSATKTYVRVTKDSNKPIWNPIYEPLMIELLQQTKIRPAVEVGKKAVEYFRGQDFVKWVLKNQTELITKFPDCFPKANIDKSLTNDDAMALGDALINEGFVYRAEYKPIAGMNSLSGTKDNSSDSKSIPKWPTRLGYCPVQKFDPASFFVVIYEQPSSWHYIMLTLIVGAVLAVCMFPAWPLLLKLALWYAIVSLATFLLFIIVFRLITFLLLWFCGVDFWLFPNLFADDLGIVDSFKPIFTFEYRNDGWTMVGARIFLIILTAGTVYQLSRTHNLIDVHRFAAQQFLDVIDWGHQKLAAPPAESSVPAAKYSQNNNGVPLPPDPYECMKPCGFQSFEAIEEECIFDCQCMKALVDSHCFKNCPGKTKDVLINAQDDACRAEENAINMDHDDEL